MGIQAFVVGAAAAWATFVIAASWAGRKRESAAIAFVVGALAFLTAVQVVEKPPLAPRGQPPASARGGYAGSQTCRSCHTREHNTWQKSFHSRMTQAPSDATILAPWKGTIDAGRFSATLLRKGAEFWVKTPDLHAIYMTPGSDKLKELPKLERRIVLVTGSHHKQIYWYTTGRANELEIFPFLWLIEAQRWVPRDAAFLRERFWPPRSEKGRWNDVCITCHTTGGRPLFADENGADPNSDVVDYGIGCESCHGEGANHRKRHGQPWRRYAAYLTGDKQPADDIVQPTRLDPKRSAQVCGQCHATWIFADELGWKKNNDTGTPYRPGDDLADTIHVIDSGESHDTARMKRALHFNPKMFEDVFWSDGMIKMGGREYSALLRAPCFYRGKGDKKLTCTHCHSMHRSDADDDRETAQWTDDQLAVGARGDAACLSCHAKADYAVEEHTHHALNNPGSRCQNCHMPYATYTLLKATRNHMVAIPSAATAATTGRPDACSLCHLDKPLLWTARAQKRWWGMPIPKLSDDHKRVPATVVWGLSGDAVQRAIVAWNMGNKAAQDVSGTDWLPMVLIQRLLDPYPAVRYIAARSLRSIAGFEGLEYDYIAARKDIRKVALAVFASWKSAVQANGGNAEGHLYKGRVNVVVEDFERLLEARDDTEVSLPE